MLVSYENKLYDIPNNLFKVEELEDLDFNNKHGYVSNFSDDLEGVRSSYVYRGGESNNIFYKGELELVSTMERNDVTYQMMLESYLVTRSLNMLEEEGLSGGNIILRDLKDYLVTKYDSNLDAYNIPVSFKNFTIHRRSNSAKYDGRVLFSASGKSLEKLPNIWEDTDGVCWGTYVMNSGYDAESMDKQFFSMIFNTDLSSYMDFLNEESLKYKLGNLLKLRGYFQSDINGVLSLRGNIYAPSVLILCSFLGINLDEYLGKSR